MAKTKIRPEKDLFAVGTPLDADSNNILRGLTEEWAELDLAISECKKKEEVAREARDMIKQNIIKILTSHGLKKQEWADGLGIASVIKKHPSVPSEFADKFKQWLKSTGDWELLAKIPSQTIQTLLRERMDKREAILAMLASTNDVKHIAELNKQLETDAFVPEYVRVFEEQGLKVSGKAAAQKRGD